MQNAKDTFYLCLQRRLAALNPGRTMVTRGVVRPAILVVENELVNESVQADIFRLEWTGLRMNFEGPLPLETLTCSIRYSTDGDSGNGGMNRGRLLSAMDAELAARWAHHRRTSGR